MKSKKIRFMICSYIGRRHCIGMDKDGKCSHRKKHKYGTFCDECLCAKKTKCVPYRKVRG